MRDDGISFAPGTVNHVFRPMKNPAVVGELRSHTWAMEVYLGPNDGISPVWSKRCREYWERQQQLYGIVLGDFTNLVEPPDPATGKPAYISTYAPVLAILPGERHKSLIGAN